MFSTGEIVFAVLREKRKEKKENFPRNLKADSGGFLVGYLYLCYNLVPRVFGWLIVYAGIH